jgi:NDP-sugar pyrophosphorylase family protein
MLNKESPKGLRAVILAGGKGTRLLPYTIVVPKPMLPIGEIPIIEIISRQLNFYGFDRVVVSLGHLSGMIKLYLEGKPQEFGLPHFDYFEEDSALGTSGPLKAINPAEEHFLAINGDILTTLNMREMYDKHVLENATLTIGVRQTNYQLPLGSIEIDESSQVIAFKEKPTVTHLDNIGAYVYSKRALKFIEPNEKIDVNILVERLLAAGEKVLAYRSDGPYFWIDIGTHADYEKANIEFEELRKLMPFLDNKEREN